MDLNKREGGGAAQSVRGNCKYFKGTNLTVVEGMHQFIMYILQVVQRMRRGRSVRRGGGVIYCFGVSCLLLTFLLRTATNW